MGNWKNEIARARFLINTTFGKLRFVEESHQYFLTQADGTEVEYECVSNFTKQWDTTTEEDWKNIRERYAKKHGETADYWKKVWDENAKVACEGGTLVHEFAESCGWVKNGETDRICPSAQSQYDIASNTMIPLNDGSKWALKQQAVRNFYDNLHPNLHFVMAETKVYTSVGPFSEPYLQNYAGTFDLLMYYDDPNDDNKSGFVIMDWKGLPLDTKIPTPNGFVLMKDLKEGMVVFDKDGRQCKILHCSEVHHNPCYKITFDNGEEIVADKDHRWFVNDTQILTTVELKNAIKNGDCLFYNPKPIECEHRKLPIDPYVLGVWLGVGIDDNGSIPSDCTEIVNVLKTRGVSVCKATASQRTIYGLNGELKKLNLLKNKHIPTDYMFSAYNQRLDLLRGLMDVIGEYDKQKNRFSIPTQSDYQKDYIVSLLSSLGAKTNIISNRYGYTVFFLIEKNPFLMKTCEFGQNEEYCYRKVISVEKSEQVPTRCIEVDSESHTYLATEQFIVTHNTNKSLTSDFKQTPNLHPPFDELKEEAKSHYTLQLSCYQIPMEAIGLKVIARRLIWLQDNGELMLVPLPNVTDRIREALRQPRRIC